MKTNEYILPGGNTFGKILLEWYTVNKRDFPWRKTTDPYKVWISEIILQQTRTGQGLPYYERFVSAFPTVEALADASVGEVLRLWQGLGYYSRARNLHSCAIKIVRDFGAEFPRTSRELMLLPGIGPYTAAAVASICFGERVLALDGNVIRVLTRFLNYGENMDRQVSRRHLSEYSETLIPEKEPGHFNQALMDFGSAVCKFPVPDCRRCPLAEKCAAFKAGRQEALPVRKNIIRKKDRYMNYLVFLEKDFVYMRIRPDKDIWQGLYEFYLIETPERSDRERLVAASGELLRGIKPMNESVAYKHVLTHQNLFIGFYVIKVEEQGIRKVLEKRGFQKYTWPEVEQLPKPIIIERFLKEKII